MITYSKRTWEQRRSFDEIVPIVRDLQNQQGPAMDLMRDVLQRYNGEYIIPLPNVEDEPSLPPLTPALVADAVDSMGMRAASVRPTNTSPALDDRIDKGPRSREYSQIRRKIIGATYHHSKWKMGRRRYYRHLAAYSTASIVVVPNFDIGMPQIQVRDPLGTFSEPQAAESLSAPEYVAFVTRFSGQRLRRMFPEVRSESGGPIAAQGDMNAMWDVVEWMDCEQTLYGLLGPTRRDDEYTISRDVSSTWAGVPFMQLGQPFRNYSMLCPGIVPVNLSLGRLVSRLGSMLGNVDLQAKLMALSILAQEKAIFPDTYAIGRQGMMPQIVGGRWKDGREGDINLLMDVETVGVLRSTADPRTDVAIDRLERNFRVSNSLIPQTGGETYGALRTGRGIDSLTSVALDPRIQELHEISEEWLPHMNAVILAQYLGNWPGKKYQVFSGYPGDTGLVEFTPSEHIETLENVVSYTAPGADIIQQTQILGSMLGTRGISLKTFRARHPWIEDPEFEGDQVASEEMEDALRQSIMQQLTSGALPMILATKIHKHLVNGDDIFVAVEKADDEVRAMQATAPPAEPPPGMIASPEQMPGLAAGPGAAMAPASPPPAIAPNSDVQAMKQLMQSMQPV